jgi:hypothetical protein
MTPDAAAGRPLQHLQGRCHRGAVRCAITTGFPELTACGIDPFHRQRVTPDRSGLTVHCLDGFDPAGIPVRAAVGAAMP